MTSHLKVLARNARLILLSLLLAGTTQAGPVDLTSKEIEPKDIGPKITDDNPWHFNVGVPGWLAGISGDIGVKGHNSSVDVDFETILRHVDFIASFSAEARKGRFGVYADFLYLEDSAAVYNNGMLSKLNISLSQYVVDGEVFYRIYQGPRGWIDLRAGARYINSYSSTQLVGNARLIDDAAANLANALDADLKDVLKALLKHRLDGNDPILPVPPLGVEEKKKLLRLIIAARQDPVTAQAKIARVLNKELNRTFGLTERWLDPYIGIGGRYNLTKAFYLTAKADVGGFGVGSDISVQAYGALGCQITRSIYSELGYRYLYEDYRNGGYLYRTSTQGIQITTGLQF